MSKVKEISKFTYKAGATTIRKELLPARLPHMSQGWRIDSMEMRAAGQLSDGRKFQDLRVYLKEEHNG